ncbi:hypothetical protein M405DRAFT_832043 [Rhizopogon salebrosus TDB-379]|nr:hypothetical protein M405DRAFT_832043 [Rhizopogon salebrosus TDB-379]
MYFPSSLNSGLAVQSLLHDLNHHLLTFRTVAAMTLSGLTCGADAPIRPLLVSY